MSDAKTKPTALPVIAENIPEMLTARPQWVLWRYEFRKGKWTKPPYQRTGDPADSTDPTTWCSFADALAAYRAGGFDGIGFVPRPEDELVAGDADDCFCSEAPGFNEDAGALFDLNSYTEVSPSGKGLRAFALGKKPGRNCKKAGTGFELYDGLTREGKPGGRFLTLTGHRLDISGPTIERRQQEIERVYFRYWPEPKKPAARRANGNATSTLTDADLLAKMFAAKNGAQVRSLWDGDTSAHGGDDSAADLALCCHLAYWLDRDASRIETAFNTSKLGEREKWTGRKDYRERTIARAIEGTQDVYTPPPKPTWGPAPNTTAGEAPPSAESPHDPGDDSADPHPPCPGALTFANPQEGELWNDPHRLARLFVDRRRTAEGWRTCVRWRDEFFQWEGGAWRPFADGDLDACLAAHCREVFVADLPHRQAGADAEAAKTDKPAKPVKLFPVTGELKGNVRLNLAGQVNHQDCGQDAPFWLWGCEPHPPAEVIAAPNGLFTLEDIARGRGPFEPPSPRFFTPNALQFAAPEIEEHPPRLWMECLRQWFNGDAASILALQEWAGLLLSANTAAHKILLCVGPPRSGKGTVLSILTALVGNANVASTTFAALGENFGLEPLIGKRVAIVPDARLSGRTDVANVVERLLSISGEDAQTVNRKNRPRITTRLNVRFVLATNEIPRLQDASGALASRFEILSFRNSYLGKEDRTLKERLIAELPAILTWGAKGYMRLRKNGMTFTQNAAAAEYQRELEELSSPVKAFVRERCSIGPKSEVLVNELFSSWREWNEQRDRPAGPENLFGRDLHAAYPELTVTQPRRNGVRVRVYRGIGLRPRDDWGFDDSGTHGTRAKPTYAGDEESSDSQAA